MLTLQINEWYISLIIFISLLDHDVRANGFSISDVVPPGYNHLDPPDDDDSGEPVTVQVSISHMNLRTVDESDMTYSASLEIWMIWSDKRLLFNSSNRFTLLDNSWKDKIWNPKLYFRNAVEGKLDNIINPSSLFWLTMSKQVYNCNRIRLKAICEMELHAFPHDHQECDIQICSSTYTTSFLRLQWNLGDQKLFLYKINQYEVQEIRWNNITAPLYGSSTLSCLTATIVLKRRIGFYIINVYAPTVLIVVMSMLTFWVPPDAVPARTTLGVTSLLTIITKQREASMPPVSYIIALNVWLSGCIGFVFFSLLEFAVVIVFNSKKSKVCAQDTGKSSPMVILQSDGSWTLKNYCSSKNSPKKQENVWPRRLDVFSRYFFPVAFVLFAAVYWYIYSSDGN